MRVRLLALFILLDLVAGCAPKDKCGANLIYNDSTGDCIECPKNASPKNDACVCNKGFTMKGANCVAEGTDSGMSMPEEDAGMMPAPAGGGGATCADYCSFNNTCIGMNGLAGALGTLSADLHADDVAACKTSCQSDLGSKEAGNAALACMKTAGAKAMCSDPNPQNGLKAAFGVIEECCGTRGSDALCKSICTTLTGNPIVGSMITFCP